MFSSSNRNQLSTNRILESREMMASVTVQEGTDVLQEAIDSVSAAGGGTVHLEAGVYRQTDTIELKSDVAVEGEGRDSVILWASQVESDINQPLLEIKRGENISNVKLSGFKIQGAGDGSSSQQTNMHGILIDGKGSPLDNSPFDNSDIALSNLEVTNFVGHGVHIKGTEDVSIDRSLIHRNGQTNGDLLHNAYFFRTNNVQVTNSSFNDSVSGHGIRFGDSTNAFLGSSEITGNADHGIHVSDSDLTLSNNMQPGASDQFGSYDNMQEPDGLARDLGEYNATVRIDSGPPLEPLASDSPPSDSSAASSVSSDDSSGSSAVTNSDGAATDRDSSSWALRSWFRR